MINSDTLEVAIGVVFVWLLLSLVISAVNEALVLLFRIRSKHLWLGVSRFLEPRVAGQARKMIDTVISLPFGIHGLDVRPKAGGASADAPLVKKLNNVRDSARVFKPSEPSQLQELYSAMQSSLTDVALEGRRSKVTAIPATLIGDAITSLAANVHRADLHAAAVALQWSPGDLTALDSALDGTENAKLSVEQVRDFVIGTHTRADLELLYDHAATMFTARDFLDFFRDHPDLSKRLQHTFKIDDAIARAKAARTIIEGRFDLEMNQLSALYRRQSRKVMALLAIPVALLFQGNVIATVQSLQHDASLRQSLVSSATSAGTSPAIADYMKTKCTPADPKKDEIKRVADQLRCPAKLISAAKEFRIVANLHDIGGLHRDEPAKPIEQDRLSFADAWAYLFQNWGWIGRLITVVALLFGAQFWFDILRRLVGIKSSLGSPAGGAAG